MAYKVDCKFNFNHERRANLSFPVQIYYQHQEYGGLVEQPLIILRQRARCTRYPFSTHDCDMLFMDSFNISSAYIAALRKSAPKHAFSPLVRRIRKDHHPNRSEHDLQISEQAAMLNIINIQLHHIHKSHMIAPAHLPQAGTTRFDQQALLIVIGVLLVFAWQTRTWADQAHRTIQDVPQLRQFIDGDLANDLTHFRHPRIVFHLEHCAFDFVLGDQRFQSGLCVSRHGAEFVHPKQLAASSNAHLREENRASRIFHLNGNGHDQEDW